MDPQTQFCPNEGCRDKGRRGGGNIRVHNWAERRYRCTTCRATFAATRGTPYFRPRTSAELVTAVVALLCHGCPLQAVVAPFGLDERTVACWWERAGRRCERLHAHLVQTGQVELGHVQADEIWVKMAGTRVWQAMALAVPSRLWLGGVVSPHRDLALIRALVRQVRACVLHRQALLTAAMYLVGMAYNYCWTHESLGLPCLSAASTRERTPAMAAGLTDHPWTLRDLLSYQIPPTLWVAPKRRGRPPKSRPRAVAP